MEPHSIEKVWLRCLLWQIFGESVCEWADFPSFMYVVGGTVWSCFTAIYRIVYIKGSFQICLLWSLKFLNFWLNHFRFPAGSVYLGTSTQHFKDIPKTCASERIWNMTCDHFDHFALGSFDKKIFTPAWHWYRWKFKDDIYFLFLPIWLMELILQACFAFPTYKHALLYHACVAEVPNLQSQYMYFGFERHHPQSFQ